MTLIERIKDAVLLAAVKDMELYRDMQGAYFFSLKGDNSLMESTYEEAAAWSREHLEPEVHARIFPDE